MNRMQDHFDSAPSTNAATGSMQGFDPEFTDIIDYILRITYRIWEGKQVGLCYDYYSDDCPVYTIAGMAAGADEVVQNTLNTLAAFPDRTLHAEAVICGGDDINGFHTSHLIDTEMTNLGDSDFGAASGKAGKIKVIAHCIIKDNKIIEEWLVRDNYLLAEQLGFDPHDIAKQKANIEPQERFSAWRDGEFERLNRSVTHERKPFSGNVLGNEENFIRSLLQNIWNARLVGEVRLAYAKDATIHASAKRELNGHVDIEQFYVQFLGTLSDLKLSVDYVCQQNFRVHKDDTEEGIHLAARWTLTGEHTGTVLYGEPTHAPVLILGESHYHIVNETIKEEWSVFDELAVLTQIYRARAKTCAAQSTRHSTLQS